MKIEITDEERKILLLCLSEKKYEYKRLVTYHIRAEESKEKSEKIEKLMGKLYV